MAEAYHSDLEAFEGKYNEHANIYIYTYSHPNPFIKTDDHVVQRTDSVCGMSLVRSDYNQQNDEQEGTLLLFTCHVTTQAYNGNALFHVAFKDINAVKCLRYTFYVYSSTYRFSVWHESCQK